MLLITTLPQALPWHRCLESQNHSDDFCQNSGSSHREHECKRHLLKSVDAFVGRTNEEEGTGEAQAKGGERM